MAVEDYDKDLSVVVDEALLASVRGPSHGPGESVESLKPPAADDGRGTGQSGSEVAERPGGVAAAAAALETPVIDGYGALRAIGKGGFSAVFEALEFEFERWVAVKVLDEAIESDEAVADFERECRAMGGLSGHPNIVTVFSSAFTSDRRPCIVMELFPHGNYLHILQRSGPLGLEQLLPVSVRVAGALATAHNRGMVHGDVKPQNIFRSQYELAALGDFGIATLISHRWSSQKTRMSLYYAAPEIIERGAAAASPFADQYSLAATIYTLATGSRPYEGDGTESTRNVLVRTLSEPPPRLGTEYPAVFGDVLHKAMSRRLRERFRDLSEFAEALVSIEQELGLSPSVIRVGSDAGRYLGGVVDLSGPRSRSTEPSRERSTEPSRERSTERPVATGEPTAGHEDAGGDPAGGVPSPTDRPARAGDPFRTGELMGAPADSDLSAVAGDETILRPQRPTAPAPAPDDDAPRLGRMRSLVARFKAPAGTPDADVRSKRPSKRLFAGIAALVLVGLAGLLTMQRCGGADPETDNAPIEDRQLADTSTSGVDQPQGPSREETPGSGASADTMSGMLAVSGVVTVAGPGSLTVSWEESSEAIPPEFQYRVQWAGPDQSYAATRETVVDLVYLSTDIDGLLGGRLHKVRVRLESGDLAGPWASVEGVPLPIGGIPGTPGSLEVEESSVLTLAVAWTEPADDGGSSITEYVVGFSGPDSGGLVGVPASQLQYEIPTDFLSAATDYVIEVWAVNARGRGEAVSITASTQEPPIGLAFASDRVGGSSVYSMNVGLDGFADPTPVVSGPQSVPRSWSPDRVWVAADVRDPNSDWEIAAYNLVTGTSLQLTCNAANDWGAAWSPDGALVAFARLADDGYHDLVVLDVATGEETLVTSGRADDTSPSWSPDGRTIAFARGDAPYRDIWTVGADGGSPRQLTSGFRDHASPSWSPDGSQIAYASGYGSDRDIKVIGANGGTASEVTRGTHHDDGPSWSPDGTSIAFARGHHGGRDILSVGLDGGDVVPLMLGDSDDWAPVWSNNEARGHVKPVGCEEP